MKNPSLHLASHPTHVCSSLRRLSAPHALQFGNALLKHAHGGTISFSSFIDVARDWVAHMPDESAFYLASLIALDMSDDVAAEAPSHDVSRN